jgi:hypothetical protein
MFARYQAHGFTAPARKRGRNRGAAAFDSYGKGGAGGAHYRLGMREGSALRPGETLGHRPCQAAQLGLPSESSDGVHEPVPEGDNQAGKAEGGGQTKNFEEHVQTSALIGSDERDAR